MSKVSTAQEMQKIDRTTIGKYGIAGIVLMERAGLRVVEIINKNYPDKKTAVLCGSGNNGGDGFVVARELHNQGRDVEAYLLTTPASLKGDAKTAYNIAKKFGVNMRPLSTFIRRVTLRQAKDLLVVDALLGTGLSKNVRGLMGDVISKLNRISSSVVSVDIPSGISSDSGQVMGCAVRAHCTVTFGLAKRGHLLYPGADHSGKLFIEDIGFPQELLRSEKLKVEMVTKNDLVSVLPLRPAYSHKGTYGHVLVVGGSRGKTGAPLMAARACLRSGAGLVTIGIPESLVGAFQTRVTEEMILPLPDKGNGTLSYKAIDLIMKFLKRTAHVLAIGPGLSVDREITDLVSHLITQSKRPLIIDADGINALAHNAGILKKSGAPVILTPHPGEMARLLKQSPLYRSANISEITKAIEKQRLETAQKYSQGKKAYLVLKGVPTITAAPDGRAFINTTGNPGMATAGSGDVLTGIIAALVAQGLKPEDAAFSGVYLHGLAGDAAAQRKGRRPLIASDIINAVSSVYTSLSA